MNEGGREDCRVRASCGFQRGDLVSALKRYPVKSQRVQNRCFTRAT